MRQDLALNRAVFTVKFKVMLAALYVVFSGESTETLGEVVSTVKYRLIFRVVVKKP